MAVGIEISPEWLVGSIGVVVASLAVTVKTLHSITVRAFRERIEALERSQAALLAELHGGYAELVRRSMEREVELARIQATQVPGKAKSGEVPHV